MADDFQVCNGNWWTTAARTPSLDVPGLASVVSSASCSTAFTDVGGGAAGFGCKVVSGDEPIGSGSACSSITYQEIHRPQQVSDSMVVGGGASLMDSGLQLPVFGLSSPVMDWNHAMISRPVFQQELPIQSDQVPASSGELSVNIFKDMNQGFLQEQHHLSSGNFSVPPACYEYPPTHLYASSPVAYRPDELPQASWAKFPQLNFANNTPFWNASAGAAVSDARSTFVSQAFDRKQPNSNSLSIMANSEAVSSGGKKSGSEPAFKKPRMETPSPLPTFKVRKEKLGDRITALQQLVSPFGKTDTASVLHEAIEYIKFLHEQVGVLSTPYLKNGHAMQHQKNSDKPKDGDGPKQDLRSRGLCLVPISSTYPVASETPADFWTPTFGGTYR